MRRDVIDDRKERGKIDFPEGTVRYNIYHHRKGGGLRKQEMGQITKTVMNSSRLYIYIFPPGSLQSESNLVKL